jgi:hypothetical protein
MQRCWGPPGTHRQTVLWLAGPSLASLPSDVHLCCPGNVSGLPCGKQREALAAQRDEATHQAAYRQYKNDKEK